MQETAKQKRPYASPELTQYGDLRELTKGSHGPNSDSGAGKAGSKQ